MTTWAIINILLAYTLGLLSAYWIYDKTNRNSKIELLRHCKNCLELLKQEIEQNKGEIRRIRAVLLPNQKLPPLKLSKINLNIALSQVARINLNIYPLDALTSVKDLYDKYDNINYLIELFHIYDILMLVPGAGEQKDKKEKKFAEIYKELNKLMGIKLNIDSKNNQDVDSNGIIDIDKIQENAAKKIEQAKNNIDIEIERIKKCLIVSNANPH